MGDEKQKRTNAEKVSEYFTKIPGLSPSRMHNSPSEMYTGMYADHDRPILEMPAAPIEVYGNVLQLVEVLCDPPGRSWPRFVRLPHDLGSAWIQRPEEIERGSNRAIIRIDVDHILPDTEDTPANVQHIHGLITVTIRALGSERVGEHLRERASSQRTYHQWPLLADCIWQEFKGDLRTFSPDSPALADSGEKVANVSNGAASEKITEAELTVPTVGASEDSQPKLRPRRTRKPGDRVYRANKWLYEQVSEHPDQPIPSFKDEYLQRREEEGHPVDVDGGCDAIRTMTGALQYMDKLIKLVGQQQEE